MERELSVAIEAVRAAASVLEHEGAEVGAALAAIEQRCSTEFPGDAWLGSTLCDAPKHSSNPRAWVGGVHPAGFVTQPQVCVCVALIRAGAAEVGVSYVPSTDTLVAARRGGGTTLNGKPVRTATATDVAAATVLVCRGEIPGHEWISRGRGLVVQPVESFAHAMLLVATGEAHAALSVKDRDAAETCAGTVLVEEAGGVLTDRCGRPLTFWSGQPRLSGVIAAGAGLWGELRDLLREEPAV